jgi:pimeloyl-ACP methyl ester carboxylesterase
MVQVPGAQLYCKIRGTGPTLLMLAGGSGDADSFNALADNLEDKFTVITYDRRGYARSPLENAASTGPIPISTQSDDASRILSLLSPKGAFVFGNSAGAFIGLDLLLRHAGQVHRLVAHEPPLIQLLPSESTVDLESKNGQSADDTLRQFAASLGIKRGLSNQAKSPRQAHNSQFFLAHEAPAIGEYSFDVAALTHYQDKLLFAGGAEGKEYFPYQCAYTAAQKTHTQFIEFPGRHNGFGVYPDEFAKLLSSLFLHNPSTPTMFLG